MVSHPQQSLWPLNDESEKDLWLFLFVFLTCVFHSRCWKWIFPIFSRDEDVVFHLAFWIYYEKEKPLSICPFSLALAFLQVFPDDSEDALTRVSEADTESMLSLCTPDVLLSSVQFVPFIITFLLYLPDLFSSLCHLYLLNLSATVFSVLVFFLSTCIPGHAVLGFCLRRKRKYKRCNYWIDYIGFERNIQAISMK